MRIFGAYNPALARYGVVRETITELTPAREHVLAAQEIVVRSLCDLLYRNPDRAGLDSRSLPQGKRKEFPGPPPAVTAAPQLEEPR